MAGFGGVNATADMRRLPAGLIGARAGGRLRAAAVGWEPVSIPDPPGVAGRELAGIALG